jgi:hypothetical protein
VGREGGEVGVGLRWDGREVFKGPRRLKQARLGCRKRTLLFARLSAHWLSLFNMMVPTLLDTRRVRR